MTNNFTISIDIYSRKLSIVLLNKKYEDKKLKLKIHNSTFNYESDIQVSMDYSYYNIAIIDFESLDTISIELYLEEELVHKEEMSFRYKHGVTKTPAIKIENIMGMGDLMALTPIMRKLHKIYNQRVSMIVPPVKSSFYELFYNNPDKNLIINQVDFTDPNGKYDVFTVFDANWNSYYYSDLRQLCAHKCGISLKEDEMDEIFVPREYEEIENLPTNYVCINPAIRSTDRNWEKEQWQTLVDRLNIIGIPVVLIGRDFGEEIKSYHNIEVKLGLNLCGNEKQNSLSQTWHIINKSEVFIGFDTGIYILAGTTDTHILLMGWYGDPFYHQPYRKGNRNYKFSHIRGNCPICCLTDPKYDIAEHGTIKLRHPVVTCPLNTNFACKPTPDMVFKETVRVMYSK
jgi:hypothetical protein